MLASYEVSLIYTNECIATKITIKIGSGIQVSCQTRIAAPEIQHRYGMSGNTSLKASEKQIMARSFSHLYYAENVIVISG